MCEELHEFYANYAKARDVGVSPATNDNGFKFIEDNKDNFDNFFVAGETPTSLVDNNVPQTII